MIMKALSFKCFDNKIPFNSVKSFSQVKFKKESFLVPTFKIEAVNYLLSNNDIGSNVSTMNKSSLQGVNNVREVILNSIS